MSLRTWRERRVLAAQEQAQYILDGLTAVPARTMRQIREGIGGRVDTVTPPQWANWDLPVKLRAWILMFRMEQTVIRLLR